MQDYLVLFMNISKRVTIGRKPGNTIVLTNADVSGDHAVLTLLDERTNTWELQDLGSRNGTLVDGVRIFRKEISPINQVIFGQTPLEWSLVLNSSTKEPPSITNTPPKIVPTQELKLEPIVESSNQKLKKIYEDYMAKKSRLEEIQRNEALNARYQSLGIPIAALFGASIAFFPPEYRFISIIGSLISFAIASWSFFNSKKFASEKRGLNLTKLNEQFDINYRCPHCQIKISDPYPVLLQVKNCRSCKKPIIT